MALQKSLQNFLAKNKIKYEVIEHRVVYTAHDKAATLHVKPNMVGKTMAIVFDKKNYMLGLIPANKNLDKKKLLKAVNIWLKKQKRGNSDGRIFASSEVLLHKKRISRVRPGRTSERYSHADFAKEAWMKKTFKGIDVGATPPIGIFYNLPFFIDNSLTKQTKIIVNAGKYSLSFKISPANLLKLNPGTIKGSFSMPRK